MRLRRDDSCLGEGRRFYRRDRGYGVGFGYGHGHRCGYGQGFRRDFVDDRDVSEREILEAHKKHLEERLEAIDRQLEEV